MLWIKQIFMDINKCFLNDMVYYVIANCLKGQGDALRLPKTFHIK